MGKALALTIFVACTLGAASKALAFDTFWHSATTSMAARKTGFTEDAANLMQFGNFSGPDFFGPLYDKLGSKVDGLDKRLRAAASSALGVRNGERARRIRRAAIYLHFDDLKGVLDSNLKFDYLWFRLLANTRASLTHWKSAAGLTDGERKICILMTLGASLHMVQDFYAHTNWIHQDFAKLGLPPVKNDWGKQRAPTWMEVRKKLGDPANWPFRIRSGLYPPPADGKDPWSHTRLNHDNSQLFYDGESQTPWHNAGPVRATDAASAVEHQLFAANSAAGGSIEWIRLVEADASAKAAVDSVRSWRYHKIGPMRDELAGSLAITLVLSCLPYHWDGEHMSKRRKLECSGVVGMAGAGLASFYNVFWGQHIKRDLVARLVQNLGDLDKDRYVFDLGWLQRTFPATAAAGDATSGDDLE